MTWFYCTAVERGSFLQIDQEHKVISQDAARIVGVFEKSLEQLRTLKGDKTSKTKVQSKASSAAKKAKDNIVTDLSVTDLHSYPSLENFLKNASNAQISQIEMIKSVFEKMDIDKDGLLTINDVKVYFKSIGRHSTDLAVRQWIESRDIDQDGAVSLVEFIASFSLQLDPTKVSSYEPHTQNAGIYHSRSESSLLKSSSVSTLTKNDSKQTMHKSRSGQSHSHATALNEKASVSSLTIAIGTLKLGNTLPEVLTAIEAIVEYIRRVLDSPTISSYWSIPLHDKIYHAKIGRLFGGTKVMHAIGFLPEENSSVIALRNNDDKPWEIVPFQVRNELNVRLDELLSHKNALLEPTISNIAAG